MTSSRVAEAVAAELAAHLTDVVVCPGSRNAPLVLAIAAHTDIRIHVRIDERSAAFLALGLARAQRRVVGVVMTSGTAVANCMPAMVEATYADVPLLVISADRPEYLVGSGANQTIEQVGIFGVYASTVSIAADAAAQQAQQATLKAISLARAHLNVAFDEPLVGDTLPETTGKADKVFLPPPTVNHGEIELDLSENTLVIAGDGAWEVPGLEDVPTIAEPTAPAPFHPVHPLAATVFEQEQISAEGYVVDTRPKQIVVVGHPTLHRGVLRLLGNADIKLIVLSRSRSVTDPFCRATATATTIKTTNQPSKQWLKICEAASELAATAVRDTLAEDHGFTGLHVAAAIADTLGTDDYLVLGSSNPVRDASLVGLPFAGVSTFAPRGAAGIDGTVSQAIGIALAVQAAHPEQLRAPRTVALLGDLTFLHDIGGLLICNDSPYPENLTIVVANDNGGGIFETLEVGKPELRSSFEHLFGTPHGVNIKNLVDGYGAEFVQVDSLPSLIDVLIDNTERPEPILIIEARTQRDTRRALHEKLAKKVGIQQ